MSKAAAARQASGVDSARRPTDSRLQQLLNCNERAKHCGVSARQIATRAGTMICEDRVGERIRRRRCGADFASGASANLTIHRRDRLPCSLTTAITHGANRVLLLLLR